MSQVLYKSSKICLKTYLALIWKIYMKNFNLRVLKLTEEFEVMD